MLLFFLFSYRTATVVSMSAAPEFDYFFKIVIVGDYGVGKTSFVQRFCGDSFHSRVDFGVTKRTIDGKVVKLQVWDTSGLERFCHMTSSYYRGSNGIVLAFDITNQSSFDNVRCWLNEIKEKCKLVMPGSLMPVIVLVGTKLDLAQSRVVDNITATRLSEELGFPYLEASALTGQGVEEAFTVLERNILLKMEVGSNDNEEEVTPPETTQTASGAWCSLQ